MARSTNIDCIGWHNMRRGEDSIVVKYDDTKSDKDSEKFSDKNLYSNPTDMYVYLISEYSNVVNEYVRVHHYNVRGICKGSGIFTSCCSTHTPSTYFYSSSW